MRTQLLNGPVLASLGALALAGCSVTADVIGSVGNGEEIFHGEATGYASGDGTIDMTSDKGTHCAGNFRYQGLRGGYGRLSCNDGRSANIEFVAIGSASGYGYGRASDGSPISFTYGLSEEESRLYIVTAPKPRRAGGSGTGFFVSRDGHVLTNHHVAGECDRVTARLPDGSRRRLELIASDPNNDLAVGRIAMATEAVPFADRDSYRTGDAVVVFGFPLSATLASGGNLTTGTISALAGLKNDSRHLQITAPVQPGNSGGPVVDRFGSLVGVVDSKLDAIHTIRTTGDIPQNVNFAIKDVVAKNFLRSHGIPFVERPAGAPAGAAEIGTGLRGATVALLCEAA